MKHKNDLEFALQELATLYEYGHLQMSVNPAEFIKQVVADIKLLRSKQISVYRRDDGELYLVRELNGQHEAPPDDYKLVASIDARVWVQSFLNYDKKDRNRMIRELEGKVTK